MLYKFAIRNIWRNQRRSLVAIGSIAVGVFGLLFLQGFFSGLIALHKENSIHSRFGHGQIMTRGYWGQPFEKPWDRWIDEPEDLMNELRGRDEVAQVFPRIQFFAMLSNGQLNVAGRGQGIVGASEEVFFDKMNFISGHALGADEEGLVLGVGLARALGIKIGDPVTVLGQTVHGTINAVDTRVVGIFHVGMKEADDSLFQIQLSKAQVLLGTSQIESLTIALKDEAQWENFSESIHEEYPELEAISLYVLDQVWAENGELFLTALLNIFRLVFVGMIMLAIYNSASHTVLERKRELGMLRAHGEGNFELIQLLLIEAFALALIGAFFGVVATYFVAFLADGGIPMPPTPGTNRELPVRLHLHWTYLLTASCLGMLTATLASFFSTLQVLKLSVVKALKSPL
jgi:putative ABC transport system permease protein